MVTVLQYVSLGYPQTQPPLLPQLPQCMITKLHYSTQLNSFSNKLNGLVLFLGILCVYVGSNTVICNMEVIEKSRKKGKIE